MPITGTTRVFYILGDPVAQVRAPEVYNHIFQEHGIDAVVVPLKVAARDLSRAGIAQLSAALSEAKAAQASEDFPRLFRANVDFREAWLGAVRNKRPAHRSSCDGAGASACAGVTASILQSNPPKVTPKTYNEHY